MLSRKARASSCLVVNQRSALVDTVAELHHLEAVAVHADALVAVLAEDQRLAVLEQELIVGLAVLVGDVREGAVVEDVAVLQDLDERGAAVLVGAANHLLQVLGLDVDAARDEGGLGAERHGDRVKRDSRSSRPASTW